MIINPLSNIQYALTYSNTAFPLNVVCVLQLKGKLTLHNIESALKQIQSRHSLLQVKIVEAHGTLTFQKLAPLPPIVVTIIERHNEETWRTTTEHVLNTKYDQDTILMKCWHVANDENSDSELIICFHHAIIDGIAARLILHEILTLAGGKALLPLNHPSDVPVPTFPRSHRGWNLLKRLSVFAYRQMINGWQYQRKGLSTPIPQDSHNAILSLELDEATSRNLSIKAGRLGLSLNSVLSAAILHVVCQHKHAGEGEAQQSRIISFADTRALMTPSVEDDMLGCYVSMMRFNLEIKADINTLDLASQFRTAIYQASRRGEIMLMSWLSKYLIKVSLRIRKERLGVTALSYIGNLKLDPEYGHLSLINVHAYISNNPLGPEFSGFGKILFGKIGLDFTYLTAETTSEGAEKIAHDIKSLLIMIAKN